MDKIKVAVLGYGHLGKWHCQKVEACGNATLFAIVEPFEANQKVAKENHPNAKIVSSIDEVMNDIDAGVIVTPTSTHFELTKQLLNNNKHVFCEKPLCSSSEEVRLLKPLLKEGKVLQVGHSERCHEAWDLLKEKFDKIEGKVSIDLNRVAAFKGRATDVDVVSDLMIHDLDLVMFLFNRKPKSLKAFGHKIRTDKWDHVTCILEFTDGSYAKITSGRNHVKEIRSMEVMHDGGCYFVDLFANKVLESNNDKYEDGSFVKEMDYAKRDHLLIEHKNFYQAILGKEKPMVTYQDGATIVEMLDLVQESLEKSKSIDL